MRHLSQPATDRKLIESFGYNAETGVVLRKMRQLLHEQQNYSNYMVAMPVTLNLWYEALGSQFGVVLQCEGGTEKVRQKLYALRAAHADPDLESLSIVQSPTNPSQLWIVRRPDAA